MHSVLWRQPKYRLAALVAALILAVAATYSPVVLDGLTGSSLAPTAAACQHTGGGC
ncbi:MAG TPA: hypothetical protein PKE45_01020 [Caldilineaceae bacterium]|nr:hypothetical protein [Caldilineaceae bacterium]